MLSVSSSGFFFFFSSRFSSWLDLQVSGAQLASDDDGATTPPPPPLLPCPAPHAVDGCFGHIFGRFSLVLAKCLVFLSSTSFLLPPSRALAALRDKDQARTLVRAHVAAFVMLFPFLFSFLCCASSAAFWLKERFGGSRLGQPLFRFILGLTILLRPLSVSLRDFRGAEADSVPSCSPPSSLGWACCFFFGAFTPHSRGSCRCLHRAVPRDVRARPSAK